MKYPFELFKEEVENFIRASLKELGCEGEVKIETPPAGKGDLSFACFPFSKLLKKPPEKIADEIASGFKESEWIGKVVSENGYVNFFVNEKRLAQATIDIVRKLDESYGSLEKKHKKVIIEHTSANPTGPLHVGRARNPILGDTLVRIYRFAGYDVEVQFYVDDMGKQVAALAWGIKNIDPATLTPPSRDKPDHYFVRFYQKAYQLMQEKEEIDREISKIVKECERGNEEILKMIEKAYMKVLDGIKQSLERLDIRFDRFVVESSFVRDGSVAKVVEALIKSGYARKENGAWYIDMKSFGVGDKKFYFTRSDGTTLYATRDIAYHLWKAERADMLINVLGEDHKLEAKQVEIALKILGAKTLPKVVFYSFVTLPGGKMSTRKGRAVYLDDLIDEAMERAYEEVKKRRADLSDEKLKKIAEAVATGCVRYNIIRIQPEKDIVFKWEDALNFEGNSAPFIQYAHARACSILRKEKIEREEEIDATLLEHEQEIKLIKLLARFPEVVNDACESNRPNLVANYLFDVASQFNQFYRDCPVLRAGDENLKRARLALVDCTRITLRNGLQLLGIKALEEM
ncbi:MAG: arginine--tRNA ligase [Thermoplasmata archaeon]|nr:MAG: arginine--tRNA ligase [Thermoplasmata archaeon]